MSRMAFDWATPSLNEWAKLHWTARLRLRRDWQWRVRCEKVSRNLRAHLVPVKITLERYGPRMLDYDNLVGGAKPLLDALKQEGLILDDSPAHLTVEYRQFSGTPGTRICIEPWESP